MNETYHIPANFTDAGRVMGLFELRNLVERSEERRVGKECRL